MAGERRPVHQTTKLRVRWFVDELLGGRRRGIYIAVELDPRDYRLPDRTPIDPSLYDGALPTELIAPLARLRADLDRFSRRRPISSRTTHTGRLTRGSLGSTPNLRFGRRHGASTRTSRPRRSAVFVGCLSTARGDSGCRGARNVPDRKYWHGELRAAGRYARLRAPTDVYILDVGAGSCIVIDHPSGRRTMIDRSGSV